MKSGQPNCIYPPAGPSMNMSRMKQRPYSLVVREHATHARTEAHTVAFGVIRRKIFRHWFYIVANGTWYTSWPLYIGCPIYRYNSPRFNKNFVDSSKKNHEFVWGREGGRKDFWSVRCSPMYSWAHSEFILLIVYIYIHLFFFLARPKCYFAYRKSLGR